jgi:hypothetical protein
MGNQTGNQQHGWGSPPRPPSPQIQRNRTVVRWVLIGVLIAVAYLVAWMLTSILNAGVS